MTDRDNFDFGITLDNSQQTSRQLTNDKSQQKVSHQAQTEHSSQDKITNEFSISKQSFNLSQAGHPLLCILTILFKGIGLFIYLFLGSSAPVLSFIIVILCSSLDFWTIKNIAGRLLVGLRWWKGFDENGKEVFRFETHGPKFVVNTVDKAFFWGSQFVGVLIWGLLLIIDVLGFKVFWTLLVAVNLAMSWTNLYAFYKCRSQYAKTVQDLKKKLGRQGLFRLANALN